VSASFCHVVVGFVSTSCLLLSARVWRVLALWCRVHLCCIAWTHGDIWFVTRIDLSPISRVRAGLIHVWMCALM
jgi:hypothetical protein